MEKKTFTSYFCVCSSTFVMFTSHDEVTSVCLILCCRLQKQEDLLLLLLFLGRISFFLCAAGGAGVRVSPYHSAPLWGV